MRWLLSASLAAVLPACTALTHVTCPARGGAEWRALDSDHFHLVTDLPAASARGLSLQLENTRRALLADLKIDPEPPGVFDVIVYRKQAELEPFVARSRTGFTASSARPLVVFASQQWRPFSGGLVWGEPAPVATHEMTHLLSLFSFPHQPLWFAEGLAEYAETVEIDPDTGKVTLGQPLRGNYMRLESRKPLTLGQIWGMDRLTGDDLRDGDFYASAWLWFHTLLNRYPKQFAAFETEMRSSFRSGKAFDSAFEDVSLFAEAQSYLGEHTNYAFESFPRRTLQITPYSGEIAEHAVSSGQFHAVQIRAWLAADALSRAERLKRAREELAEGLVESPDEPRLLFWGAVLAENRFEGLTALRKLLRAQPGFIDGWAFLAQRVRSSGLPASDLAEALDRGVIPADVKDPVVLSEGAREMAEQGRLDEAERLSRQAVAQAPWDPESLDVRAFVLARAHRCADARQLETEAIATVYDRVDPEHHRWLEQRWGLLVKLCPGE